MASGQFNTMAEGLQKLVMEVASLMGTPDADIEWLTDLQAHVTQKIRQPIDGAGGGPLPPAGADAGQGPMPPELAAMMGGGGPAAMGPGIGAPPPGMPGPMPGGPSMSPQPPNPDELRRLMS